MPTLLLIDGNAILHRAYHAYPPTFTDGKGNPTNAIYGFYAMLLKVLEDQKPDYLTICFDRGAPTFRMNMYAGYHANRPKMSDDLAPQVPKLQESLEYIGIPLYGVEGYEADDLLGTLSAQAAEINTNTTNIKYPISNKKKNVIPAPASAAKGGEKAGIQEKEWISDQVRDDNTGLETIILTGDRDLLQLVSPHVKILMPITGITKSVLFDEQAVEEKYGVKASQFIDYKAIVGDQSDGYPGVSGIGPKGAATLLKEWGTLENIYTHLGDLKVEVGQKLASDAEQCSLAKALATIHRDAPVHLDLEKAKVENFTPDKFLKIFEEFNIHSLARRLMESYELGVMSEESTKKSQISNPKFQNVKSSPLRSGKKSEDQLELL